MKKNYVITFSISLMVAVTICIILLMIMVPQNGTINLESMDEYVGIYEENYKFVNTKNITDESVIKQYVITSDLLAKFKKNSQYKPGNSNPFTPSGDLDNSSGSNNQGDTNDNTTNSNGGNSNGSNTNK